MRGKTDFRMRRFEACRLRLKKKVREPAVVWKHTNTRTATNPIPKIWGKVTFRPSITAYVVGDDCFDQRDRLIDALNKPGPGTLVHPTYGELKVCVDGRSSGQHIEK